MRRTLLNLLTALSLLLCVAAAALWVRGYWRGDYWPLGTAGAALALTVIVIGLWIDWKLNWRKARKERRGFEIIAAGAAEPPQADARPLDETAPQNAEP